MATTGGRPNRVPLNKKYPGFPYVKITDETPAIDGKLIMFARNLADTLEEFTRKGWVSSQRDFAEKTGITISMLSNILSGRSTPNAETIAKLETKLHRPLWDYQLKSRSDKHPPFFPVNSDGHE